MRTNASSPPEDSNSVARATARSRKWYTEPPAETRDGAAWEIMAAELD
jgi:hypothetical protein